MQANELTRARLRRLAGVGAQDGKVLSLFLNLDPREFATPPARDTAVRSVIDRARRLIEDDEGLSQPQRKALREDLERAQAELGNGMDAKGAHGLAVFASSPADLFEVIKLPQGIDHEPVVGDAPFLEPIHEQAADETWAVVLVNRRTARLFLGSRDGLAEVAFLQDDVHGQHDQGGWSQARYQRSVDEEVRDHLKNAAELAFSRLEHHRLAGLAVGGPTEIVGDLEAALHPYLQERLAGRVEIDVENTSADDVRAAAQGLFEQHARRQEDEALDRLRKGLGRPDGRAAAGLPDVLAALHERRVEVLLVDRAFHAPGARCPQCEMLHTEGETTCPADGAALEPVDDVVAPAMDAATGQDAQVLVLHERPDLGSHGHIAATLRF